jgi:hypothetical protein
MTPPLRVPLRRCAVLLAAVALTLAACGDDGLPAKRPADLTVRYSWNLAPADVTGALAITAAKASYRDRRGANQVRFTFAPAAAQLDALWRVLRDNRIDTIERVERKPDLRRAVETLIVRWGDRTIALTDGVKVRIRAEDQERWRKVQLALRTLILAERRKRGLPAN